MKIKMKTFMLCIIAVLITLTSIIAYYFILDKSPGSSEFKIESINNNTKGDVDKNPQIKANIPDNNLTKQIVSEAKNGTPVIIMGSGDPKVMIIAGVFGNELPSQVAAIHLINNLKDKKLKGTVYIIPFAIPSSTEQNQRNYNNTDPNRVADTPGSPLWTIVYFAKKNDVKYAADFHSTQPGGDPGRKVVTSSKDISYESFLIADYMARETGSEILPNSKYAGTLKYVFNSNGIPSVTAEVVSEHGTVDSRSVEESYSQMEAFLKFSGII